MYYYVTYPDCWTPPFEGNWYQQDYASGLGCTYSSTGEMWWQLAESLVYFKKGSETWGTSVTTDCITLVPAGPAIQTNPPKVNITPNPVCQTATITIDGYSQHPELTFQVFDHLGRNVLSMNTSDHSITFNRNGLPGGLYIYLVTGKDLNITGKVIFE